MTLLQRFYTDSCGALSILFVLLLPLLLLVGGLATDVTFLNAQKRYVQSQADLATLSASRYLPDPVKVRAVARSVVARNSKYGILTLSDAQIKIGRYDALTGRFMAASNQINPEFASAVQVTVPSPFNPILLAPVLEAENIVIRRSSVGVQRGMIAFTLRNRLISLDSDAAILGRLLGPLGLGLNTELLGYRGLADTRVNLNALLALVAGGEVAANSLSFNQLLDLEVSQLTLLLHLVQLGGLAAMDVNPAEVGPSFLTLGQIVGASPQLLATRFGDILPDTTLNVFDLVVAFAALAARPEERLGANLALSPRPLTDVSLSLGLIRPPVIAVGYVKDAPPPTAVVSQVDASVTAKVLDLGGVSVLTAKLDVGMGLAKAYPLSLNCAARAASDQLALFNVQTAPVSLGFQVGLLDARANVAPHSSPKVQLNSATRQIPIRLDQYRKPVKVTNPLTLTAMVSDVATFLEDVRLDLRNQVSDCTGPLAFLLCPLGALINLSLSALLAVLSGVAQSLASILSGVGVDKVLQSLLDLLGIGVAQADLILDSYSCDAMIVR